VLLVILVANEITIVQKWLASEIAATSNGYWLASPLSVVSMHSDCWLATSNLLQFMLEVILLDF
jgi:hypothetical protein